MVFKEAGKKRIYTNEETNSILDTVLWEKASIQQGLDLYLNTHMTGAETVGGKIAGITAEQLTTEKVYVFDAKIFIDCTGDGSLAALSGAEFMSGREGKRVFGESDAPDESDSHTMGNTLLFKAVDFGHPAPFEKPFWANSYREEDLAYREHHEFTSGYWWIELGGDHEDVVADGEKFRDELLKAVYGVWDHIKNSGHHNAHLLSVLPANYPPVQPTRQCLIARRVGFFY